MLIVCDLEAGYGDARVLHKVSITVTEGEIVTVMGPNGAGKSTLLRTIAGALKPTSGTITWGDQVISGKRPKEAVRCGIALVPEGRHIFQALSIHENLALGAYTRKDRKAIQQDIDRMCDLFPILHQKRHAQGREMSGGEQQMLAIARGLMSRPTLLLLDEPSLGLAPIIINSLPGILREIAAEFGTAILLVEQNSSLALTLASRGYLLEGGRIIYSGSADAIRELVKDAGPFVAGSAPHN